MSNFAGHTTTNLLSTTEHVLHRDRFKEATGPLGKRPPQVDLLLPHTSSDTDTHVPSEQQMSQEPSTDQPSEPRSSLRVNTSCWIRQLSPSTTWKWEEPLPGKLHKLDGHQCRSTSCCQDLEVRISEQKMSSNTNMKVEEILLKCKQETYISQDFFLSCRHTFILLMTGLTKARQEIQRDI